MNEEKFHLVDAVQLLHYIEQTKLMEDEDKKELVKKILDKLEIK